MTHENFHKEEHPAHQRRLPALPCHRGLRHGRLPCGQKTTLPLQVSGGGWEAPGLGRAGKAGPQVPGWLEEPCLLRAVGAGAKGCSEAAPGRPAGLPPEAHPSRGHRGSRAGSPPDLARPHDSLPVCPRPPGAPAARSPSKNKCDIEAQKLPHQGRRLRQGRLQEVLKYEECKYEAACTARPPTTSTASAPAETTFTTSTSQMTYRTSASMSAGTYAPQAPACWGCHPPLLGAQDTEHEESSSDDLVDFSALSSKNSSLSASPTSQQSSASLATACPASEVCPAPPSLPTARSQGCWPRACPAPSPWRWPSPAPAWPGAAPLLPHPSWSGGSASLPVGAPAS